MPPSDAIELTVAMYQMQEIYYVVTTIDEEVGLVSPQRWSRGKILFVIIRNGTVMFIALEFLRNYRTYVVLSPKNCKVLEIVHGVALYLSKGACDGKQLESPFKIDTKGSISQASLALCLGALIQAKGIYLFSIMVLAMGPAIVGTVFGLVPLVQYPAEPVSKLEEELGYPCYAFSNERWHKSTIAGLGSDSRRYFYFAATAALVIMAAAALATRYRSHKGRLVQVLRRDGGMYCFFLAGVEISRVSLCFLSLKSNEGVRFGNAITNTPAVLTAGKWAYSPTAIVIDYTNRIAIPVLAQRMLINLRKADEMGSQPLISQLHFASSTTDMPSNTDGDGHAPRRILTPLCRPGMIIRLARNEWGITSSNIANLPAPCTRLPLNGFEFEYFVRLVRMWHPEGIRIEIHT
ncbi:hypothetical protein NMY22_g3447 [Coprinellus aureogranulatus]|nr:hypothetical protein NMY22_g3447 [Coprinellus aureogranulatus]